MKRVNNRWMLWDYFHKAGIAIWDRVIKDYFGEQKYNRAGRIYLSCSFHSEATPSLVFNRKKKMFLCFGCGCGGSIVDFVGRMEGLRGYKLMRYIEKAYGFPMPHRRVWKKTKKDRKQELKLTPEQKMLRKINKLLWIASQEENISKLSYEDDADIVMQLFC